MSTLSSGQPQWTIWCKNPVVDVQTAGRTKRARMEDKSVRWPFQISRKLGGASRIVETKNRQYESMLEAESVQWMTFLKKTSNVEQIASDPINTHCENVALQQRKRWRPDADHNIHNACDRRWHDDIREDCCAKKIIREQGANLAITETQSSRLLQLLSMKRGICIQLTQKRNHYGTF